MCVLIGVTKDGVRRRLLKLDRTHAPAWILRGQAFYELEQFDMAIRYRRSFLGSVF